MRALLQRVTEASVTVDDKVIGKIGPGLMILLGVRGTDTAKEVKWVADKCANLRIFEDEHGKFHHSALDVNAEILIVSQFTLYGDCRKGRRPGFTEAGVPAISEPLYEMFVEEMRKLGFKTETGQFGAMMLVDIKNDGPVTLMVEKEALEG